MLIIFRVINTSTMASTTGELKLLQGSGLKIFFSKFGEW